MRQILLVLVIASSFVSSTHYMKPSGQCAPRLFLPKVPLTILQWAGSRSTRAMHYMWHQTRNRWERLTDIERAELVKIGWYVPRPALKKDGTPNHDNDSGEDFLYMHREMIKIVNEFLEEDDYEYGPRVVGWKKVPAPGDKLYPVPQVNGTVPDIKTDNFYNTVLVPLEKKFTDPVYLKSKTLGQTGSEIEWSIHNYMHGRWATPITVRRQDPLPFWDFNKIDKQWDDLSYDWLGDTYSSQVNPIFWKLHGWIDDRINDWAKAHGVRKIKWKGKWIGPEGMDMREHDMGNMGNMGDMGHVHEGTGGMGTTNPDPSHSGH